MLSLSYSGDVTKLLGAQQARLKQVTLLAPAIHQAMRFGHGGLRQGFATSTEIGPSGTFMWPRTKPFGTRQPGIRALRQTGAYEAGWLGRGAGSMTTARAIPGGAHFAVGIDAGRFPQARVFQAQGPTLIKPKKMGKRGRYAMAWFLGMRYGVWLSNARLEKGFLIQPRRLSINNSQVRANLKVIFRNWVLRGRVTPQGNA